MTDATQLERRYRRLLAWYPRAFRQEHEEEMLVVPGAWPLGSSRSPPSACSRRLLSTPRPTPRLI
jgi:hypothetical protein